MRNLRDATQRLFKRLEDNEVKFIISDLLELELIQAPKHVSELLLKYPADRFERIELTQEIMDLANKYISEKIVGRTSLETAVILPWRQFIGLTYWQVGTLNTS